MIRPMLFRMDPERAHELIFSWTQRWQDFPISIGLQRAWGASHVKCLSQELFGCDFSTPVGLAAGLDKNGTHLKLWQMLGFGAIEIGSVTARSSVGNPKPRLFRLPEDEALINRMGLNNDGPAQILRNIAQCKHLLRVPLGINLAKTHDPGIMGEAALEDFVSSYTTLAPLASYITLNVSCPNTTEGKTFEDPEALAALIDVIVARAEQLSAPPPLLVKLSPPATGSWGEEEEAAVAALIDVMSQRPIAGLIIANTAPPQSVSLQTSPQRLSAIGRGGLSGKPLVAGSGAMLRAIWRMTAGELPLIGVGGIDSPESAYQRIKWGASLIQLYTGMIYQGPGLIRRINRGLVRLLDSDGYGHISEAIGVEAP